MFYWEPYITVAERKERAAKKIAELKKKGHYVQPIVIQGRTISRTFWGKAWCTNLEFYSDYSNRLPRGRSYVRNGSVIDLRIKKGEINALVSGSSMYTVNIFISALNKSTWKKIIKDCSGKIDSLIELLQGKFSKSVMEIITDKKNGLFPDLKEIDFKCSCPDYAHMCKHVAAVLYGVGTRLDEEPEKLFLLRQVDSFELISAAKSSEKFMPAVNQRSASMDETSISALFGIEIDQADQLEKPIKKASQAKTKKAVKKVTNKKQPKAKPKLTTKKSKKKQALSFKKKTIKK